MITTFLFDLDGTLLPMETAQFLRSHTDTLSAKMAPYGYDTETLIENIWLSIDATVKNDGSCSNKDAFWSAFERLCGHDIRTREPVFLEYYEKDFQQVRRSCGFDPRAKTVIDLLKKQGYRLILATNPLFPAVATHSRVRWAGLDPNDFQRITTYENSRFCKRNPDYYRDILDTLQVKPEQCVMVGNDVEEDMIAESLGIRVFLLTDCLINRSHTDITRYPHGSFDALLDFIGGLNP